MVYNIGDKVNYKGHMGIIVDISKSHDVSYLVSFFETVEDSSVAQAEDGIIWNETLSLKGEDLNPMICGNELYFAKVKDGATIPSKREEDGGYDVYACFEEDYIVIQSHETKLIPTGLASAVSSDYVILLRERGSNGSKGIAQRCGVIDSGYRNEWFVPLTNTTTKTVTISKLPKEELPLMLQEGIVYPYSKGIAQALIVPVPKMEVHEVDYETLKQFDSERGMGALGSSGK